MDKHRKMKEVLLVPAATSDNWSELPELVLYSVLRRLRSFPDFLSFSSVCRSWRALSTTSDLRSTTSFPPLLLLSPSLTLRTVTSSSSSFKSKVPSEILTLPFLGYSNGHLIFHSPTTSNHHLLLANVFTGHLTRIPSPPNSLRSAARGGGGRFRIALLLADTDLILAGTDLILHYRSATRSWRELRHGAASLALFQNKIYCVDPALKRLTVIATESEPTMEEEVQLPVLSGPLILCRDFGYRLAASGADLLLLRSAFRFSVPHFYPVARTFDVFRLDPKRSAWEEVGSLGDRCVFLDAPGGCATACPEPGRWGGRSGCVYVAGPGCDDGWEVVPVDDGGDRRFEIGCSGARDLNRNLPRWPSPVWVYPAEISS